MDKNVCIVHFNTPEITEATIKSLNKTTTGCKITVLDNSDKRPFPATKGINIIDNTKGQVIDFDKWLDTFPRKKPTPSNWGSEKHIRSIEYLMQIFDEGFLLLDSDVLIKKDVSCFFDNSVVWAGDWEDPPYEWHHARRVLPYCLWINVPMCKKHGIHFMSEGRIFMASYTGRPWCDTGASFYQDCDKAGLPVKQIDIFDYVIHLAAGSWKSEKSWRVFLDKYRNLFEDTSMEKNNTGEQILVVIPYCSNGAQGRELEYSVAGWRRHFKENYLIVLAGEDHPITKTGDDIICIKSERVPQKPGQYRQHIDYVSCFKKVRKAFPNSKGFIFVADDCYAVNDFDMTDILCLKQKADDITCSESSTNAWQRDKAKTRAVLVKGGYPTRNFTTHLPQWFEWDKLEKLWDEYDMENESYVFEDLYYNIYFPTRIPLQLHIDFDNFKCGVYRPNPRLNYITNAFNKKIWIQNSVEGWIPFLDKALADYYGI